MNLGQILAYANLKLGKDFFGGYISPSDLNGTTLTGNSGASLLQASNIEMLNRFISVYEKDRIVTDDLRTFVKTLGDDSNPPLSLSTYGYGTLPTDFVAYADIYINTYVQDCDTTEQIPVMVEMLDRDKFNYRRTLKGALKPRSDNPIGTIQNDQLLILPNVFPACVFTYIRMPLTPYFDYDIVNDEIVYLPPGTVHQNSSVEPAGTPSLSVEYEWPEQLHEDLGDVIVKYYAVNFRSEFNIQTLDLNKPTM